MKTSYTVARLPDDDWDNLLETVTLDGSYSDEIKSEVWAAVEKVQFYSTPWVVVKISKDKPSAKIFGDENSAQKYFLKEQKKLQPNEQVFCLQGQYR